MLLQPSAQSVDLFLYMALGTLHRATYQCLYFSLLTTPTLAAIQTVFVQVSALAGSSWDPTIVAAIIGAATALVAALIAVVVAIYQTRQSHKTERENRKLEREKDEQQRHHDREIELFRRELDMQYREKEQERQREEAALHEMLIAQNNVARAIAYRKALQVDPRISRLQILDMQRPLEMTNIYVRVRVHEDTATRYAIDPSLVAAAQRRDPDSFFQARHHYLEQRVGTAIDPDAAIHRWRHCVIVGDPGAGKTTLLKYLALMLADGKYPDLADLPIHVELNAFVYSEEEDVLDYAAHQWEERYAFPQIEARGYMDTMLKNGKAILLLDALDETVIGEQPARADVSYQKAWNAIMRLVTRYPQACIVVTARKAGYQQRRQLDGFTVVEVMDFQLEDIREFVENWFRCTQGMAQAANADDLIVLLNRNPRIQALAANPLLLSLIVLVYEAQLDLPNRRAELYRECVDVLLTKWDAKRNIRRRRSFKPDQKRQLLAEVAWHFHQQGRRYFPEQDLLTEIAHFLPALGLSAEDNRQVLEEITTENGLLKEQARGWYGFLHLTLQEYFATIAVNDQTRFATLVSQCADPWWEEVLLLYAGQTPDASPLLLRLLSRTSTNPRKDDLFYTNLLMAGRCLTSFPTIRQKDLRERVIKRIITLFQHTPYSRLRYEIIEILSMIGGDTITSRLVALLKDSRRDHFVRIDIALALRQLGKQSVAQDLVRMLKDSQITDVVRMDIAVVLGLLGEKSVAADLLDMLKDSQITDIVRGDIAAALGQLGEKSVAPDLVEMLKDSHLANWVCSRVAEALGRLGEQSVVPDLLEMLKDSQVRSLVRGGIARALGQLGERSVAPDLVEMLRDNRLADWDWVRSRVAEALGQLGEQSVVPDLLEMLKDSQIGSLVRGDIARALGQLGERSVAPDLVEMLKDSHLADWVCSQVAEALGRLGERSVVPGLLEILKDTRVAHGVRKDIAVALGQLRGEVSSIGSARHAQG